MRGEFESSLTVAFRKAAFIWSQPGVLIFRKRNVFDPRLLRGEDMFGARQKFGIPASEFSGAV